MFSNGGSIQAAPTSDSGTGSFLFLQDLKPQVLTSTSYKATKPTGPKHHANSSAKTSLPCQGNLSDADALDSALPRPRARATGPSEHLQLDRRDRECQDHCRVVVVHAAALSCPSCDVLIVWKLRCDTKRRIWAPCSRIPSNVRMLHLSYIHIHIYIYMYIFLT